MTYDIFSSSAPAEPRAGKGTEVCKFLTSKASTKMRQPLLPMAFPALSAHIHDVKMKYSDGRNYEIGPGQLGHLVGASGIGKRELNGIVGAICRDFEDHDAPEYKRLAQWSSQAKTRATNSKGKERPNDLYFLFPPNDITKPAFAQNTESLEQNGGLTQYMNLSECEQANRIVGSHSQVSVLMRSAYDVERGIGQLRATEQGISANPVIRLCLTMSSTPQAARDFYKRDMTNGFFSRVNFSFVPREERIGKIPKVKDYDEAYLAQLDRYLLPLKNAHGGFHVKPLNRVADQLAEEMADLANFADSDELFEISHRCIFSAWKKAAVLWLLNDQTYTRSIGDYMVYFCYYDLWSKLRVFDDMLSPGEAQKEESKRGPKNFLDELPNPFSEQQLENLRTSHEKPKEGTKHQLAVWTNRGYIEYSAQTAMYSKTEKYLNSTR